jgi:hypothetical protein
VLSNLQERIEQECAVIRRKLANQGPLELCAPQFEQLDQYRALLANAVGEKQASAMMHDLYRKTKCSK